jgi:hypothetical protein
VLGACERGVAGREGHWGAGRENERESGIGELTSGSKSNDHRLQNLGHHGEREREMGERGGCCAGELNERKRPGEGGGAPGAGQGARKARAELGQAGSGWARSG